MLEMIDQSFVPKGEYSNGDRLVETIDTTEETEIMRLLLYNSIGLRAEDKVSRSQLLHLYSNNDMATLDEMCNYIDLHRKPRLSERFWDDSECRKFVAQVGGNKDKLRKSVEELRQESQKRRLRKSL